MDLTIIRGSEESLRAGAYYVRIQAMAKEHHISLQKEIDCHDGSFCHYILILDGISPVATCRWFEANPKTAEIGRVVVLPEYRGQGMGRMAVSAAEPWIQENGYGKIILSSRDTAAAFYEKLGYQYNFAYKARSDTFSCIYMEKFIDAR